MLHTTSLTTEIPGVLADSVKFIGLDSDHYHSDIDTQSCSLLKAMLTSPADYKAQFFNMRSEPTKSMDFGTLIHLLILEPHLFSSQYAVYTGKAVARDAAFKEFAALHPGLTAVDEVAMRDARSLADKILNRSFRGRKFGDYVAEGQPEVSIYYSDPATGVRCRVRIDLLHPEYVFDLKTTVYPGQREWLRHGLSLHYDMQAYMYSLAACLHAGKTHPDPFVFITGQSEQPYSVSAFTAGDTLIAEGGRKYQEALSGYAACLQQDYWPDLGCEATLELDHWQVGSSTPAWRTAMASGTAVAP
jgi:hypothetical protein